MDKTCPKCGVVFSTSKVKKQDYCTADCRKAAKKEREDRKYATISSLKDENTKLREEVANLRK